MFAFDHEKFVWISISKMSFLDTLKNNKLVVISGVVVVAVAIGVAVYWFYYRPKYQLNQEVVGEPVVPLPRIPLPQGTRPAQRKISRLPKATPGSHFPTEGQSTHISAADAIRSAGNQQYDDQSEEGLDGFFEGSGFSKDTKYPDVRR